MRNELDANIILEPGHNLGLFACLWKISAAIFVTERHSDLA